ncbi:MAG: glycosyltransferase family 39 protein [Dehalococcoidia bacterium]|jgi:4-amino-4-deoxy-L-arabinose transferase-like glycosyltransferase
MEPPEPETPTPEERVASSRLFASPGVLGHAGTWVALLFGLALALRVVWAFQVQCDPRTYWRWDMTIYDFQASAFSDGYGYVDFNGDPTAHWPPGYPMALTPIYRLTGKSLLSARLANAVAGSLTVVLIYMLGAKVFGRTAGLIGAGLLAVMPNQIVFTSLTLTEVFFTLLFVLILLLTAYALLSDKEARLWKIALIGALIGAAALVRGEALVLLAVIPPVVWLRRRSWRSLLARSIALVLAAAVVVAPWTVRNAIQMKAPILISTSATEAFWVAHHDGANGKIADFAVTERYQNELNPKKEVDINNEALREALSFLRHNPAQELTLIPRRFFALYSEDASGTLWLQTPATLSFSSGRHLREVSDLGYWGVMALAAVGFPAWLSLRDRRKGLLVAVAAAWTLLFIIVFFGDSRFHFSLTPIFCLWAGASATASGPRLRVWWQNRRRASPA